MKRIWKFALAIAGALGWTGIFADMVTTIEILGSITLTQLAIAFQSFFTIALVWWIWRDIENPPIIFGGFRLRRLSPLLHQLQEAKDRTGEGNATNLAHISLAGELTYKLDKLGVPHPDLFFMLTSSSSLEDKRRHNAVIAYLVVLRRLCVEGDFRAARSLKTEMPNVFRDASGG